MCPLFDILRGSTPPTRRPASTLSPPVMNPKMPFHLLALALALACLPVTPQLHAQTFSVDGFRTGEDSYTGKYAAYFYNGHGSTISGTRESPLYQTYIRWGVGKVDTDPTGQDYFFMYVETPIEIKNMVWGAGMTAEEVNQYGSRLDFSKATSSEYISFYDSSGNEDFWSYTVPKKDYQHSGFYGGQYEDFGMIDAKTSVDYILDNGLGTTSSSANSHIGMAFEYQFLLNTETNNRLLDVIRDGGIIEYHLSPERGLVPTQVPVPEPSGPLMVLLGSAFLMHERKRVDGNRE